MTLEEVFKFVEAKEAGKRSASRLLRRSNEPIARDEFLFKIISVCRSTSLLTIAVNQIVIVL